MKNEMLLNNNETQLQFIEKVSDISCVADDFLMKLKTETSQKINISVPIDKLATLGAGVSSLLPVFRSIQETIPTNNLYRLVNAGAGDALKLAKDGTSWGAIKTADGASKMAKFQSVSSFNKTTIMPVSPAVILMTVALFSIENKLGNIAETQKQILSFLEVEKESEIEADLQTVSNVLNQYKHNWDNEHFVSSNHKLVVDIQRTARKHITSYQKKIKDMVKSKPFFISQSTVKSMLNDLIKYFQYYNLSLFTYAMSALIEIMLSGNFQESNISAIKDDVENLSMSYREVFSESSVYIEDVGKDSVETNVLKGFGAVSKAFGGLIGNIPLIKEGQVDEFLQDCGNVAGEKAELMENDITRELAKMCNPSTQLFTEKMQELIQIYNHTTDICFDKDNIYLIAG